MYSEELAWVPYDKPKKEKTITLSADEAEVLENYLERKCYRLEEADLKDSYCYPRLLSVLHKVRK